jgi:hypothetical protein
MGLNLWGVSPLYVNPVNMLNILTKVLDEGKGVAVRNGLKEAPIDRDKPLCKSMSQACPGLDPGDRNGIQGPVSG